jgi:hypothetical protein
MRSAVRLVITIVAAFSAAPAWSADPLPSWNDGGP